MHGVVRSYIVYSIYKLLSRTGYSSSTCMVKISLMTPVPASCGALRRARACGEFSFQITGQLFSSLECSIIMKNKCRRGGGLGDKARCRFSVIPISRFIVFHDPLTRAGFTVEVCVFGS